MNDEYSHALAANDPTVPTIPSLICKGTTLYVLPLPLKVSI